MLFDREMFLLLPARVLAEVFIFFNTRGRLNVELIDTTQIECLGNIAPLEPNKLG